MVVGMNGGWVVEGGEGGVCGLQHPCERRGFKFSNAGGQLLEWRGGPRTMIGDFLQKTGDWRGRTTSCEGVTGLK